MVYSCKRESHGVYQQIGDSTDPFIRGLVPDVNNVRCMPPPVFVPNRFFRPAPDNCGQEKTEIPRYFVSGISGLVGAEGFEPSAFCSRTRVPDSRIPFIFNGFRTSAVRLAPVWVTFWVTYPIALAQTT